MALEIGSEHACLPDFVISSGALELTLTWESFQGVSYICQWPAVSRWAVFQRLCRHPVINCNLCSIIDDIVPQGHPFTGTSNTTAFCNSVFQHRVVARRRELQRSQAQRPGCQSCF